MEGVDASSGEAESGNQLPEFTITSVSFCFSFTGKDERSGHRYVETRTLEVGAAYMIQFDLIMGCGRPFGGSLRDSESLLSFQGNKQILPKL